MEKASSNPGNQLIQLQKGCAAKDAASLCLRPLLLPTCLSPQPVPAFPCLCQHPAWLIFPPALPVHAVDGLQVGQGFADLEHVEDERGHGETVLVLLQVLPQLQQDE